MCMYVLSPIQERNSLQLRALEGKSYFLMKGGLLQCFSIPFQQTRKFKRPWGLFQVLMILPVLIETCWWQQISLSWVPFLPSSLSSSKVAPNPGTTPTLDFFFMLIETWKLLSCLDSPSLPQYLVCYVGLPPNDLIFLPVPKSLSSFKNSELNACPSRRKAQSHIATFGNRLRKLIWHQEENN